MLEWLLEWLKIFAYTIGIAVIVIFLGILLWNLAIFAYEYLRKLAVRFNKKLSNLSDNAINVIFGPDENPDNEEDEVEETESGEPNEEEQNKEEEKKSKSKSKKQTFSTIERITIEKLRDRECEDNVYEIVRSMIDEDCIMRDVYINYNGIIYAIDMIVIYNTGIYAIESRTLEGYVIGEQDKDKWTQTDKNGRTIEFDNPIKYNLNQVNALYGVLKNETKVSYNWFKEYLLINGYTKLNFKEINKDNKSIINPKKFDNIFRKEIIFSDKYLSNRDIYDIREILDKVCLTGDEGREKYLNQFK